MKMEIARDWKLTTLHASADLLTFFGCVLIAGIATYIYRCGKFKGLDAVFPGLWKAGSVFVFFLGAVRVFSFLEVVFGGAILEWSMGGIKVLTASSCFWFVYGLWRVKDEIAQIGQILNMLDRGGKGK